MKIRPLKASQMDTNYLINLLEQKRSDNYVDIVCELKKRLCSISLKDLLIKWCRLENPIVKDLFEDAISERIKTFEAVVDYQEYPRIFKKYVEEVKSLDAICTLMTMRNDEVKAIARTKYYDFLEDYMNAIDSEVLWKTEGDDTCLVSKLPEGIIQIPQRSKENVKKNTDEMGKIYQFKKIGRKKK